MISAETNKKVHQITVLANEDEEPNFRDSFPDLGGGVLCLG